MGPKSRAAAFPQRPTGYSDRTGRRRLPRGGVVEAWPIGYTKGPSRGRKAIRLRVIGKRHQLLCIAHALLALVLLVCVPALALIQEEPAFVCEQSDEFETEIARNDAGDGRPDLTGASDILAFAALRSSAFGARASGWAREPQLRRPPLPHDLQRATGPPSG
jgi:hypothetical protein